MSNAPPSDRAFVLVVALDLTDTDSGGYAVDQALLVARRIPGSQVHVLHVSAKEAHADTLGLLRLYADEKMQALGGCDGQSVTVHVRQGEPGREIAQLAADLGADMIVVGTHKAVHLKALVVGSTAEHVMANATCPVVVAGPRPRPQPPHVIVIEGPCPDCVRTRVATQGRAWWCDRHAERHPVLRHHHIYSYSTELPFGQHDSEVIPTGVD